MEIIRAKKPKTGGFTLVELLIFMIIIAAFLIVSFLVINPLARFQEARNTRRWTDVNMILNAIRLDQSDNGKPIDDIGRLATGTAIMIGRGKNCQSECDGISLGADCLDLSVLVKSGRLSKVPIDPKSGYTYSTVKTGYYLTKERNMIRVSACNEEPGLAGVPPAISAER